jgi:hypothetical protein
MTDLEKLKKTFDELGIFYVEEIPKDEDDECSNDDWVYMYLTDEEEAKNNKLDDPFSRQLFAFQNGKLASY